MEQADRPTMAVPMSSGTYPSETTAYFALLRGTLLKLGTNNPDGDIAATGDFWKHCESAGVSPETAAATIYATARHKHPMDKARLQEAAESPTREEWEVKVRREKGFSINKVVAIADRKPDEITERDIIFGDFYDDEKAQAFARRMTVGGFMTTYGPRKAMAAEDRAEYFRTHISFQYLSDAEKFEKLLEKQGREISAISGGTQYGATVTTNAKMSTIERVLAKHKWRGAYSLPTVRRAPLAAEETDPSAMGAPASVPLDAPPSRIQWVKVTRDPNKFADFMPHSERIGPINTPEKLYTFLAPEMEKEEQEVFLVIPLNLRGELKCPPYEIARGQRSRVAVGVNNVMEAVHDSHCEGFLLCHNHPTGRCSPSAADRKLTGEIQAACKSFGNELTYIDHVIIGVNQYFSITENKGYRVKKKK